ncbi:PREDICTED: cytochrome P450 6B3-like [Ceratosolen solmsi marchali]|uniref:Cytochrome P450 6B3-like n=1 Tax=Ceratosolen solmsi marchali TaxID=326594 RepID=A0AAJ6VNC8_9HYME|nr:PREDICTED: cytochrome P450 6B3-like [Ceratosolen solmsi marchali]
MIIVIFIGILLSLLLYLIYTFFIKTHYDFWLRRNVKGPRPIPIFGNDFSIFIGKTHPSELNKIHYNRFKDEKMIGIFRNTLPVLILIDEKLIEHVLTKDRLIFPDRGIGLQNNPMELLHHHVFNLRNTDSDHLKKSLSKVFLNTKIDEKSEKITNIIDDFLLHIDEIIKNSKLIDICHLLNKLTTEIIGEYGFSLKMNEFSNLAKIFNSNSKKSNYFKFLKHYFREYPTFNTSILEFLHTCVIKFTTSNNEKKTAYYTKLVQDVETYRYRNAIKEKDYFGKLIDVYNTQERKSIDLTDKYSFMASQTYLFFKAGSESIAITISNALYEIANNNDIQNKLRDEIIKAYNESDCQVLNSDNIKNMKYLDKIYKETLRKYPLRDIIRICNREYTFNGTDVTIPKNTRIIIPHYALQRDERIYINPERFDPDRLVSNKSRFHYMPFGHGSRQCIAGLFAEFVFKIVVLKLVKNCKIINVDTERENDPWKIFIIGFYHYLKLHFNFWKRLKVVGPKPNIFFGNIIDVFFGKINIALLLKRYYEEYEGEKLIGIYTMRSPNLIIKDLDFIKNVLIKHFNDFSDRGIHIPKDPFDQTLLNLKYDEWKALRHTLSPTFTSSKLKEMFYLMENCAARFEKYIEHVTKNDDPIECRDLTAKYTTEIIGVCAFGQEFNVFDDDSNKFRELGRTTFEISFTSTCRRFTRNFLPQIYDRLKCLQYRKGLDFFIKSITNTMEYRNRNNLRRNDFVDLLRDMKYKSGNTNKIGDIELSNRFLTGQAFIFFAAGFETSSTTISNTFYELALNEDIQHNLRQEIQEHLENNNGKLTYDIVTRMTYLDKVVKVIVHRVNHWVSESLRKYPPVGFLQRKSVSSYTFDDTNITIPKDTSIYVPVWAIHHDPNIYPLPEKFDPERFNDENTESRHPMSYLPFGHGPHNCIGNY